MIALDESRVGRAPLLVHGYLGNELEISIDQKLQLIKITENAFAKTDEVLKEAEKQHSVSVMPFLSVEQNKALKSMLAHYRDPKIFDPDLLLAQMNFVEVLNSQTK